MLVNEIDQKKQKNYKNSGTLKLASFQYIQNNTLISKDEGPIHDVKVFT